MTMLGSSCSPCCSKTNVLAVACRNFGPTLNCWNYAGWEYYYQYQSWAQQGAYTNLSPALSPNWPGGTGGYRNRGPALNPAHVSILYGETSTSLKMRMQHYYYAIAGSQQAVKVSEVEFVYTKAHPGSPASKDDTGLWIFTKDDLVSSQVIFEYAPAYAVNTQHAGDVAVFQHPPGIDLSKREYAITMTLSNPVFENPGDWVCDLPNTFLMSGVSGSTFDIDVSDFQFGSDWYGRFCEINPAESWYKRSVSASCTTPGGFFTPGTSGPLRISGEGGFRFWQCDGDENVIDCDSCEPVFPQTSNFCPAVGTSDHSLLHFDPRVYFDISPYAWVAFSSNNTISGSGLIGSYGGYNISQAVGMGYPGSIWSASIFLWPDIGADHGTLDFTVEMLT